MQTSSHPTVHTTLAATSVVQWTPSSHPGERDHADQQRAGGESHGADRPTVHQEHRERRHRAEDDHRGRGVPRGKRPAVRAQQAHGLRRPGALDQRFGHRHREGYARPAGKDGDQVPRRRLAAARRGRRRRRPPRARPAMEPVKVKAAIQRSRAGVLCATTQEVICRSSDSTAIECVTPCPVRTSSPTIAAQAAARSAAGGPALRRSIGTAGEEGGSTTGSSTGSTGGSVAGAPPLGRSPPRPWRPPARPVQASGPQLPSGRGGWCRNRPGRTTVDSRRRDEAPCGAPSGVEGVRLAPGARRACHVPVSPRPRARTDESPGGLPGRAPTTPPGPRARRPGDHGVARRR